jgi:catechol 2,3-dioxygenase-like lactoylglutathione lyase family enzyme
MIVPLDEHKGAGIKMDMKLELVPVPVSDVDRARAFYVEKVGFHADHDVQPGNGMRVVQLTPPGSACSIVIGTGLGEISKMQPGSVKGLHLVVADINKAREALAGRGVAVGEVDDLGGIKYVYFSDPDGNSWALQEIPANH